MICPECKRNIEPINHNDRGLRCPACWYPLPAPGPVPVVKASPTTSPSATIKRTRKPRKKVTIE